MASEAEWQLKESDGKKAGTNVTGLCFFHELLLRGHRPQQGGAGAQQVGAAGAQQVTGAQHVGAAGAQQVTGAQHGSGQQD